jgi:FolB domain-containing protein
MDGEADLRIHVRQLELQVHIGVPEEERAFPQRLTFNLTLWPANAVRDLDDDIARAVNYASVCDEVEKFVYPRRDKLIETLADGLAIHLLDAFALRKIMVELRKYILPRVEFVSVTVSRERSG